jgi:hypothetical protein
MTLPNRDRLIIDPEKITEYLLNRGHFYGASKARFFGQFGFHLENWEEFADALKEHGQSNEVFSRTETAFGSRYVVEGELRGADGRFPRIRTVWQMDEGSVAPRLISAYPSRAI